MDESGLAIGKVLDKGKRERGQSETFRVRGGPTRSERMNRALKELGTSAYKIQDLMWTWRGAPAKGYLPFFTIHSLSKFCSMTRPTVRSALLELENKGWIRKQSYNVHHKNALYRLVGIRRVPLPIENHT